MNFKKITYIAILFLVVSVICNAQHAYNHKPDVFVRNYISPTSIVWQSDTTGKFIFNSNKLLETGNGQADIVGANLCVVKGGDKINSSILLDFGKEIHGGIQVVTGMHAVQAPVKVRITLGESVSEAMSSVDHSSATNDHAIREYEVSLPWLGSLEIGNSGFRFVKVELL